MSIIASQIQYHTIFCTRSFFSLLTIFKIKIDKRIKENQKASRITSTGPMTTETESDKKIQKRQRILGISKVSLRCSLKIELLLLPLKIEIFQMLKPEDPDTRNFVGNNGKLGGKNQIM
ncbi:hypothetical protein CDAR_500171 [Caerostris darwini]|uniref:Uncharacterized protein n=1 Tax=Caerostris darwini TaxID=1538125 RepID=A0AAV4MAG7_9ARAC|nr:hypothetical protein CDAR_500171 [Caerostris darwini]